MKKENIVDLAAYRDQVNNAEEPKNSISNELETAIEMLIQQLREQSSGHAS